MTDPASKSIRDMTRELIELVREGASIIEEFDAGKISPEQFKPSCTEEDIAALRKEFPLSPEYEEFLSEYVPALGIWVTDLNGICDIYGPKLWVQDWVADEWPRETKPFVIGGLGEDSEPFFITDESWHIAPWRHDDENLLEEFRECFSGPEPDGMLFRELLEENLDEVRNCIEAFRLIAEKSPGATEKLGRFQKNRSRAWSLAKEYAKRVGNKEVLRFMNDHDAAPKLSMIETVGWWAFIILTVAGIVFAIRWCF